MLVSEIINHVKYGDLSNLGVTKNLVSTDTAKAQEAENQLISYINLGLIELYKKFNISTKAEIVVTNSMVSTYQLRNNNIAKILNVYDSSGYELKFQEMVYEDDYDIKEVGYLTYLLKNPKDEELAFVYKAMPETVYNPSDEVVLPKVMLEAMVNYIGQRAYAAIGGNRQQDQQLYFNKFTESCKILENEGFFKGNDLLSKNVLSKGFV